MTEEFCVFCGRECGAEQRLEFFLHRLHDYPQIHGLKTEIKSADTLLNATYNGQGINVSSNVLP